MAVFGLVPCLGLAGCGGGETVQQALGYEQRGPDEMAVIKRPPLIVPPDYNLRPPRPGQADAGSEAARDAARRTLIGPSSALGGDGLENDASESGGSEGQNLLVDRTDRTERDLDALAETRAENQVDRALLRRLLAWTPDDRPAPAEGEVADPDPVVVQVVSRAQTVLEPEAGSNP